MLYRMLSGELPFQGKNTMAILRELAETDPKPVRELNPEVPESVEQLVNGLLEKDPLKRLQPTTNVVEVITAEQEKLLPRVLGESAGVRGVPEVASGTHLAPVASDDRRTGPSIRLPPAWFGVGAAVLLAGGVLLRVTTDKAELIIKSDDPEVTFTVRRDGRDLSGLEQYEWSQGQKRLTVRSGNYEVTIDGADADNFTVKDTTRVQAGKLTLGRGKAIVVEIERRSVAAESDEQTNASYRKLVEWALSVGGSVNSPDGDVNELLKNPEVRFRLELSFNGGNIQVTGADLYRLSGLSGITHLEFTYVKISDADLASISHLTSLRKVGLEYTNITDQGFIHLAGLTNLEYLLLTGHPHINGAGLAHLGGLKNLQELDLSGSQMSDGHMEIVAGFSKLSRLDLKWTPVTDAGVQQLSKLTNLRNLGLENTRLTDVGLGYLSELTNLISLYIGNTAVTDAGLAHLGQLKRLQALSLENLPITDDGLRHLEILPDPQFLLLAGTQITDQGLETVRRFSKLKRLVLVRTGVTDDGMKAVGQMTGLNDLNLGVTAVGDAGVSHLNGLKDLRHLWLDGTRVTDAGLQHIAELQMLGEVHLENTGVTEEGVGKLREALPHCKIFSGRGTLDPVAKDPP